MREIILVQDFGRDLQAGLRQLPCRVHHVAGAVGEDEAGQMEHRVDARSRHSVRRKAG